MVKGEGSKRVHWENLTFLGFLGDFSSENFCETAEVQTSWVLKPFEEKIWGQLRGNNFIGAHISFNRWEGENYG